VNQSESKPQPSTRDPEQLEENKRLVAKVFEVAYGRGDNFHLLDEVIAEDYIQHNPDAGQGLEGVKRFFEEVLVPLPDWLDARGTVEVNYIAEGELVVRQEIRNHGMLVDIFRVRDGLLREHWDAFRPDPGTDRIPGF
jgi:predicted SnoaL-like aldol condensation-catalyzing enzyme